jgi:hypothetical protein
MMANSLKSQLVFSSRGFVHHWRLRQHNCDRFTVLSPYHRNSTRHVIEMLVKVVQQSTLQAGWQRDMHSQTSRGPLSPKGGYVFRGSAQIVAIHISRGWGPVGQPFRKRYEISEIQLWLSTCFLTYAFNVIQE